MEDSDRVVVEIPASDEDKVIFLRNLAYLMMADGQVTEDEYKGKILKISSDKRFAVMSSDIVIKDRSNILIIKDGERKYAKVTGRDEGGYLICFTSVTQET